MSQAALAREVGVSQVAIKKIETGDTTKSRFLPKIAEILAIPLSDLDPTLAPNGNGLETRTTDQRESRIADIQKSIATPIPGGVLIGEKDLPVHALTQGGRGALVISSDPVDYVARPEPLRRVKDGYGIIVSENSMSPEFKSGNIALVHPHLPPRLGDTCVFYSEDVDGTRTSCIKQLRKETVDAWHVRQFHPKKDYQLKKSEWQTCHVTVGRYNGR